MTSSDERFAAVLREFVDGQPFAMSPGLLAKLSRTPKATVVNWLDERVRRPRRWQDVVRVADALRADVASTDRLLTAAGHDHLARLLEGAGSDERRLLEPWRLRLLYPDWVPPVPAGTFVGRHDETLAS